LAFEKKIQDVYQAYGWVSSDEKVHLVKPQIQDRLEAMGKRLPEDLKSKCELIRNTEYI